MLPVLVAPLDTLGLLANEAFRLEPNLLLAPLREGGQQRSLGVILSERRSP